MTTIQIMSDLHLEHGNQYDDFEISPRARHLALLGDIGKVKDTGLTQFLRRQLQQFETVFLVPGNHEAYDSTWPKTIQALRDFEAAAKVEEALGTFVLLDKCCYRIPQSNIVVLGCSLFSHIPPNQHTSVGCTVNDFQQTYDDWDTDTHNAAHRADFDWLNQQMIELSQDDVSIAVLTHWSPSTDARANDPQHANSSISGAFRTNLSREACFLNANVKLWAFGHTHYNCDFEAERPGTLGALRIVANQRGYPRALAPRFDRDMTIQLQ